MMLLIFMIQGRDSATGTARRSAATPAAATATWSWPRGASPSSAPASGQRRPRCCSSRPRTSSGGNLLRRRRSVFTFFRRLREFQFSRMEQLSLGRGRSGLQAEDAGSHNSITCFQCNILDNNYQVIVELGTLTMTSVSP